MFQEVAPGVKVWSKFSEAKGYDFNGTWICSSGRSVLIDPVSLSSEQADLIERSGKLEAVLFTNKDHSRAGAEVRERFGQVPFWCHELERAAFEFPLDHVFVDYDRLPLGVVAIHLGDLKTPGEAAFYWPEGRGVLIVGDAVIGRPKGQLSLLPEEKISDQAAARASLKRLLGFHFDALLVGDGQSVLTDGRLALAELLQSDAREGNA